mmetsp:Transcript_44268/g.128006  ORF Transcript_44268/g.128006 Transcript_44268/m.128006 type:complete len:229 (+) Transcript_44268:957-1643(+)
MMENTTRKNAPRTSTHAAALTASAKPAAMMRRSGKCLMMRTKRIMRSSIDMRPHIVAPFTTPSARNAASSKPSRMLELTTSKSNKFHNASSPVQKNRASTPSAKHRSTSSMRKTSKNVESTQNHTLIERPPGNRSSRPGVSTSKANSTTLAIIANTMKPVNHDLWTMALIQGKRSLRFINSACPSLKALKVASARSAALLIGKDLPSCNCIVRRGLIASPGNGAPHAA